MKQLCSKQQDASNKLPRVWPALDFKFTHYDNWRKHKQKDGGPAISSELDQISRSLLPTVSFIPQCHGWYVTVLCTMLLMDHHYRVAKCTQECLLCPYTRYCRDRVKITGKGLNCGARYSLEAPCIYIPPAIQANKYLKHHEDLVNMLEIWSLVPFLWSVATAVRTTARKEVLLGFWSYNIIHVLDFLWYESHKGIQDHIIPSLQLH